MEMDLELEKQDLMPFIFLFLKFSVWSCGVHAVDSREGIVYHTVDSRHHVLYHWTSSFTFAIAFAPHFSYI
jgi:hypothetical protein